MNTFALQLAVFVTLGLLQGCAKESASPPSAKATDSSAVASASPAPSGRPDVGKLDTVLVQSEGFGPTPGAATTDAMKAALLQVNGATIDTSSVRVNFGLDIADGRDAAWIRGSAFAEAVAQKSGGAITNFKLIKLTDPTKAGDPYKITIEANVAHFAAPDSSKRLKVVVGPVKFDVPSFAIGSETVAATRVASDIRKRVSIALDKSGRFSLLDREMTSEIQGELDMIRSGQTSRAEVGKLGQALTADLIWEGEINSFAYIRHARKLLTSDRELVSYSGGWAVSQNLVNVSTRQVFSSDALSGRAPEAAPTTLGATINADEVLQNMETDAADAIVASILSRTFPISVVRLDSNNVVLSQGGNSLKQGRRYVLVSLGDDVKDPQTGDSLGPIESECCQVVVDRVAASLSYGHLENIKISLDKTTPGNLQVRDIAASQSTNAAVNSRSSVTETVAADSAVRTNSAQTTDVAANPTPPDGAKEQKW